MIRSHKEAQLRLRYAVQSYRSILSWRALQAHTKKEMHGQLTMLDWTRIMYQVKRYRRELQNTVQEVEIFLGRPVRFIL